MAGRYLLYSDLKKRSMMFRREPHSILLHCLYNEHILYSNFSNFDFVHEPVFHYAHYLSFKRSNGCMFRSKARNRCLYNNSARAVFKSYKMSRMTFKQIAKTGGLNGVTKAS